MQGSMYLNTGIYKTTART